MARLKLGDLLQPFNVVLVSTSILGSDQHMDRLKRTATHWLDMKVRNARMHQRQSFLRECVDKWHEKDSFMQAALQSAPALLEAMWWNRTLLRALKGTEG